MSYTSNNIYIILLVIIVIITILYIYKKLNKNISGFQSLNKNIVLITSVIYVADSPLSYSINRSRFTPEERIEQTLKSITTVKEKIPNATIILIEGSELPEEVSSKFLKAGVSKIHHAVSVKEYVNSPHKSVGEVKMILDFLNSNYIENNDTAFNTISKLSGRYFLNDDYDFNKYDTDKVLFWCKGNECMTRYYRIPMRLFNNYKKILEEALLNNNFILGKLDIENYNILSRFSKNDTIRLSGETQIGVEGEISPVGLTYAKE